MIQGPCSKRLEGITPEERDALLIEHIPVVRYLAFQIYKRLPHYIDLDDLISAGVVGLIDAFSKFDHVKNVQFRSYAQFRIRGAILDSLRNLDWSPSHLRHKGRVVAEAVRALSQRDCRAPLEHEIADEMNLPLAAFQTLLRDLKILEITSLHQGRFNDSSDEQLDSLPGLPEQSPLSLCLKSELEGRLKVDLLKLSEHERWVIQKYYFEEQTMKQIGHTMGVAEARISQIHNSAVHKLRRAMKEFTPTSLAALATKGAKTGSRSSPPQPMHGLKKIRTVLSTGRHD